MVLACSKSLDTRFGNCFRLEVCLDWCARVEGRVGGDIERVNVRVCGGRRIRSPLNVVVR